MEEVLREVYRGALRGARGPGFEVTKQTLFLSQKWPSKILKRDLRVGDQLQAGMGMGTGTVMDMVMAMDKTSRKPPSTLVVSKKLKLRFKNSG